MADPNPYIVSYSFSGFQASNPDRPLPAMAIDTQFSDIAAASAEAVAAITSIRRADGGLENMVVTWDSLTSDVQNRILGSDPRVTVADINPSAFANTAEAVAGVANDRIMTPLRVDEALDVLRAYASQAEAEAGVENTKVVTPLRVKQALDALRALASQAEAEAGVENTKVTTSLRVKQAVDAQRTAFTGSASLTWGSIASLASATQVITCAGAAVQDRVLVGLAAAGVNAGLLVTAWVSSANNVTVRLTNITGSPITPHSGAATTYAVTAVRF
jgi:hypothetical protein